jgi:putative transposase
MLGFDHVFDSTWLTLIVKLVAQVKLLLTADQAQALNATLVACNGAAEWVSKVAWEQQVFRNYDLRGRTYGQVKAEFGLSAQPAQHVIKKVADAYRADRATRRRFRRLAAQPFDDRCLSWQLAQQTVSIWTVCGRLKGVRFTCGDHQRRLLASRSGESDLLFRDGIWWLLATCEVSEPSQQSPVGMLGVDLGIVNIATTSDGTRYCGSHVNRIRHRNRRLRQKLQRNGSKSAKRLLRKRRRKESRFAADVNHVISRQIVAEASRTGRGITLEHLKGIHRRVRLRKPQRATLYSWSFGQLGGFIEYKARLAGVRLVFVDPAFTSQQCSCCGHVDRGNRPNQSTFRCRRCGFAEHADVNAAVNLKVRGWAAVNAPNADTRIAPSDAA